MQPTATQALFQSDASPCHLPLPVVSDSVPNHAAAQSGLSGVTRTG